MLFRSGTVRDSKDGQEEMAERFNPLRQQLEQKTGFHFTIKPKKNGAGQIVMKFNNGEEFNQIFEFLMGR